MLIHNLPRGAGGALLKIAEAERVQCVISDETALRSGRINVTCVLRYWQALDPSGSTCRLSSFGRRTVGVTWEAHMRFLVRLFDAYPDAVVLTQQATYRGKADFEASRAIDLALLKMAGPQETTQCPTLKP